MWCRMLGYVEVVIGMAKPTHRSRTARQHLIVLGPNIEMHCVFIVVVAAVVVVGSFSALHNNATDFVE